MSRRKSVQLPLANATESLSSARALADMTTKEGTKENYKGKQRIMIDWLKVNHCSCVNRSGDLKIPVPNDPIISFFGNLAQAAHDRKSFKSIWDMWFYGNTELGIRSYKLLVKRVDIKKKDNMKHTRARQVIAFSEALVLENNMLPPGVVSISKMTLTQNDRVFERAYSVVIEKLYHRKPTRRVEEICYGGVFNLLCQYKRRHP